MREAREELSKGNVRQAAEKLWGATALVVKPSLRLKYHVIHPRIYSHLSRIIVRDFRYSVIVYSEYGFTHVFRHITQENRRGACLEID